MPGTYSRDSAWVQSTHPTLLDEPAVVPAQEHGRIRPRPWHTASLHPLECRKRHERLIPAKAAGELRCGHATGGYNRTGVFADGHSVPQGSESGVTRVTIASVVLLAALTAGCLSGRQETLTRLRTDNPRVQTWAIDDVIRSGDKTLVVELIRLLDSDDEAVRFMAAAGLHRLTGHDVKSRGTARPEQRAKSIEEWGQWWEAEGRAKCGVSKDKEPPPPAPKEPAAAGTTDGKAAANPTPKEGGS